MRRSQNLQRPLLAHCPTQCSGLMSNLIKKSWTVSNVSVCKTNALARQFEGWSVRAKLTHHAKCRGHQIRNVIIYLVNNWLNSFLEEHSYFHSIMRFLQKLLNFHTFMLICLFHIDPGLIWMKYKSFRNYFTPMCLSLLT